MSVSDHSDVCLCDQRTGSVTEKNICEWSAGERRRARTCAGCRSVHQGATEESLTYENRSRLEIPDEIEALESAHGVPHDPAGVLVPRQVRDDAVSTPALGGDLADYALHSG